MVHKTDTIHPVSASIWSSSVAPISSLFWRHHYRALQLRTHGGLFDSVYTQAWSQSARISGRLEFSTLPGVKVRSDYSRYHQSSQRPVLGHTTAPCSVEVAASLATKACCVRNVLYGVNVRRTTPANSILT